MSKKHYQYGASHAKTWMGCPSAVNYSNKLIEEGVIQPNESSEFANEGTEAHDYAEKVLLGQMKFSKVPEAFRENLKDYVDFATDLASNSDGFEVEKHVQLFYAPEGNGGTIDFLAWDVAGQTVHVLDLKYGVGVAVEAWQNPQLQIYAISAIQWLQDQGVTFSAEKLRVKLHICQPRHWSYEGIDTYELGYVELMDFYNQVKDAHELAQESESFFIPSESACRFCKARKVCQARVAESFDCVPAEASPFDTVEPTFDLSKFTITDAVRLAFFKHGKNMQSFIDDINEDTLARMQAGETFEGLKIVEGRPGSRRWASEEDAVRVLRKIPASERFTKKLISPTQFEKIAKASKLQTTKRFEKILEKAIVRPEGKPTIALESDKRPSIQPIVEQFEKIEENQEKVVDKSVNLDDCF